MLSPSGLEPIMAREGQVLRSTLNTPLGLWLDETPDAGVPNPRTIDRKTQYRNGSVAATCGHADLDPYFTTYR